MMKIEITAEGGKMRQTLDEAMATLGYIRAAERAVIDQAMTATSLSSHDDTRRSEQFEETAAAADKQVDAQITGSTETKRERGKPGPGRARRTKEEMAEDAAADAADIAAGRTPQTEARTISTDPENRVGPQDSAEVQAQDAADEKAESDAAKGGALTLDDVREAVGLYYKKFGMGQATQDVRTIFGCAMHEIPDNQEAYGKAIAAINDATKNNPYGRTPVGEAAPRAVVTLNDLKVVMARYMKKFGETEGFADLPKILETDNITLLPNDPQVYAAKIAIVTDALEANPFGRRVVA